MNKNEIINNLDILVPNPRCELDYSKDYELLLSVMLSAQCTDKRVNIVTKELFKKYDINSLAKANYLDIIDVIKSLGSYKRKASHLIEISKRLIKDYKGIVPNNRDYLESLPGVGRKTCNVVLAELFDEPTMAVDTHVERVSKRLKLANKNDNVIVIEKKLMKYFDISEYNKVNHQLLLFGRYYCKAKNPICSDCPFKKMCIKKTD